MARTTPNSHNRGSYRYATPWDLRRFNYTLNLVMLAATLEAAALLEERTRRARRVLSFFAALHRSGKSGYLGTQCTLDQLAEQIGLATGEPCGRSTLSAALGELRSAGLLTSTSYALPGAKPIETGPGRFIVRKIKIWSLTPLAISLWTKPRKHRKKRGCDTVLPVQKMDTLGSPNISFFQKENNTAPDPRLVPPSKPRTVESEELPDGNNPTRAAALKQRSSTPDQIAPTGSDEVTPEANEKVPPTPAFGVSCCPPPDNVPKNRSNTRRTARARLLRDLWYTLRPWLSATANPIYKRARDETKPDFPTHWGTATAWDRHLNRWHLYSYAERQQTIKREIVPALKVSHEPPDPDLKRVVEQIAGTERQEKEPERHRERYPAPLPRPEPPTDSGKLMPGIEKHLRTMAATLEASGKHEEASAILEALEKKRRR